MSGLQAVLSSRPVAACTSALAQTHSSSQRHTGITSTSACSPSVVGRRALSARRSLGVPCAFKVEIEHQGKIHTLSVPEGENILSVALDEGLDLPHDCRLGVCMTCPARLVSGKISNNTALLTKDAAAAGYTLLCMAEPESDCRIMTISEDELLDLQLGSS